MQLLFLFFTQSEGGAPGFLSRKGDEAAHVLADTVALFLTESLGLDLNADFEKRARSLNEDVSWKQFQKPTDLPAARTAALELCSTALLSSGASVRSLKTTEQIATQLALPVCIDERLDRSSEDRPARGTLGDGLSQMVTELSASPTHPKIVLVGTSLPALAEWLEPLLPKEKHEALKQVFENSTMGGLFPTVLAAGFEMKTPNLPQWVFDI